MVTHIPPASPTHSTTSLQYPSTNPVHPSNPSAYLYSNDAPSSSSRRRASDAQSTRSSNSSRTAVSSNPPSSYKHGWTRPRSSSRSSTRSSSSTVRPSDSQSTTGSVAPSQAESRSRHSSRHHKPQSSHSEAGHSRHTESRQSHSRSHNVQSSAATSHASRPRGSPPARQQNTFPYFSQTGDVEIMIADRRKTHVQVYLLHNMFLAQNSQWWAEQLGQPTHTDRESENRSTNMPGGVTSARGVGASASEQRRRYELYWGDEAQASSANALPVLVRSRGQEDHQIYDDDTASRPAITRNKPVTRSSSFIRSLSTAGNTTHPSNYQISTYESDLLTAYDNLFRIIYNHEPLLDQNNPATAYVQCKYLLTLASTYLCLPITGPRVEHHLMHFRSLLPQQIAKYPPSYLKLAYQARSRAILNDALIHVVGSWPLHAPQLARGDVPDRLRDLVEDKVDELQESRAKVEAKLFKLTLTTSRGERVNPSNSWLDWLAVSLFRQWVAENTTLPTSGILKTSSTSSRRGSSKHTRSSASAATNPANQAQQYNLDRIYRLIAASSSSAYLGHDELKRFLKMSEPASLYSRDTLKKFERRIEELKNLAREAARPLMRNFLELDTGREKQAPPYLTCTRLGESDWEFLCG